MMERVSDLKLWEMVGWQAEEVGVEGRREVVWDRIVDVGSSDSLKLILVVGREAELIIDVWRGNRKIRLGCGW